MRAVSGTLRARLRIAFLAFGLLPLTIAALATYGITVRLLQDAGAATRDARTLLILLGGAWLVSAAGVAVAAVSMAGRIARRLGRSHSRVDASVRGLTATSDALEAVAARTVEQAARSGTASDQAHDAVGMMATAMDELHTSIAEIARSSQDASTVASNAAGAAAETNEIIGRLDTSSGQISAVVDVITAIARKTNLLALNATIEAMRAGDAGKGFVVVANDVKELAKQTAVATEEVGERIAAIQRDTGGAVEAIGRIEAVISEINDSQQAIAAAVEEQTATTTDLAGRVTETARALDGVAATVGELAGLARETEAGVREVRGHAGGLSAVAAELSDIMGTSGTVDVPLDTPAVPARPAAHAPAARDRSIFELREPTGSDPT